MYLFETGLGETFKQRKQKTPPAKETPKTQPTQPPKAGEVVKHGDVRRCSVPNKAGVVVCDLDLKVRFRRSFDEFLNELEAKCRHWMAPTTARRVVNRLRKDLKTNHNDWLKQQLLDNDPLIITVGVYYRRSGTGWLVYDSDDILLSSRRLIDI